MTASIVGVTPEDHARYTQRHALADSRHQIHLPEEKTEKKISSSANIMIWSGNKTHVLDNPSCVTERVVFRNGKRLHGLTNNRISKLNSKHWGSCECLWIVCLCAYLFIVLPFVYLWQVTSMMNDKAFILLFLDHTLRLDPFITSLTITRSLIGFCWNTSALVPRTLTPLPVMIQTLDKNEWLLWDRHNVSQKVVLF